MRTLADRVILTAEHLGVTVDPAGWAKALGWKPARMRAMLDVRHATDDRLEALAARPGELRRRRRSTLERLPLAWGADPQTARKIVDLWCQYAPDAIAPEGVTQ